MSNDMCCCLLFVIVFALLAAAAVAAFAAARVGEFVFVVIRLSIIRLNATLFLLLLLLPLFCVFVRRTDGG